MDRPFRAPINRTAELQLILRQVAQGYHFWTADQIPPGKLSRFLAKWSRYRLLADPPARRYRKATGKANSMLIVEHTFNLPEDTMVPKVDDGVDAALDGDLGGPKVRESSSDPASGNLLHWILLSTPGKDGLADGLPAPGIARNATTREGRITWMGYELIRQPKQYSTSDHRIKTEVTWTWRLPTQRYKEIEAHLVTIAKHRRTTALAQTFAWLQRLPMFAGLRSQVVKLHQEANKVLLKVGCEPLPALKLPYVGMQRIW